MYPKNINGGLYGHDRLRGWQTTPSAIITVEEPTGGVGYAPNLYRPVTLWFGRHTEGRPWARSCVGNGQTSPRYALYQLRQLFRSQLKEDSLNKAIIWIICNVTEPTITVPAYIVILEQ